MRRLTVIERYYDSEYGKNAHGEIRIKGNGFFGMALNQEIRFPLFHVKDNSLS
jgi:hypothetical protein